MTSKTRRLIATGLMLGTVTVIGLTLPSVRSSRAQSVDSIFLSGTVHDFRRTHDDFDTTPSRGYGHDANLVALTLGNDGRPALSGAGFRVGTQWRDETSNAIAPHLFANPNAVRLGSAPSIDKDVIVDTWDPTKGPYSPATAGPAPVWIVGGPMPTVEPPTDLGPSKGDVVIKTSPSILEVDIHCDRFTTDKDTVIVVRGDCTLLCEERFELGQRTTIELDPGASLRIYADGFTINQGSVINMSSFDPDRVQLFNTGSDPVRIAQGNNVCARIVSPDGVLQINQNDHLYGSFAAAGLEADQGAGLHLVPTIATDACGVELNDTVGSSDGSSPAAITSTDTFSTWYRGNIGTNMSGAHTIELVRNGSGIYEFIDDEFFPIDDRLLGNEEQAHNYHFTYMIEASFTYDSCTGQFLELAGSDDIWAYVDDLLVIDLGGVHGAAISEPQTVDMDRLLLADGETYTVRFFFAQRSSTTSSFRLRTNIELQGTGSMFTLTAPFD